MPPAEGALVINTPADLTEAFERVYTPETFPGFTPIPVIQENLREFLRGVLSELGIEGSSLTVRQCATLATRLTDTETLRTKLGTPENGLSFFVISEDLTEIAEAVQRIQMEMRRFVERSLSSVEGIEQSLTRMIVDTLEGQLLSLAISLEPAGLDQFVPAEPRKRKRGYISQKNIELVNAFCDFISSLIPSLARRLDRRFSATEPPSEFDGLLRDFQEEALVVWEEKKQELSGHSEELDLVLLDVIRTIAENASVPRNAFLINELPDRESSRVDVDIILQLTRGKKSKGEMPDGRTSRRRTTSSGKLVGIRHAEVQTEEMILERRLKSLDTPLRKKTRELEKARALQRKLTVSKAEKNYYLEKDPDDVAKFENDLAIVYNAFCAILQGRPFLIYKGPQVEGTGQGDATTLLGTELHVTFGEREEKQKLRQIGEYKRILEELAEHLVEIGISTRKFTELPRNTLSNLPIPFQDIFLHLVNVIGLNAQDFVHGLIDLHNLEEEIPKLEALVQKIETEKRELLRQLTSIRSPESKES